MGKKRQECLEEKFFEHLTKVFLKKAFLKTFYIISSKSLMKHQTQIKRVEMGLLDRETLHY